MIAFTRWTRLLAIPLLLAGLFSDFLSPVPPDLLDLKQFFAPPSRIHFMDARGTFHWRPFVQHMELTDAQDARYVALDSESYPLVFFCKGYQYRLFGLIPCSTHLIGVETAGVFHPWGTDKLGRDILARTLAGARNSILVLIIGIAIYFMLGLAIGACAGMAGGCIDTVLMRLSEFVLALPALYLVLAVRALLPPKLTFWQAAFVTSATLASVAWPPMARGVRGLILQIQNACYVEAARALGASPWHIFRHHIFGTLMPFALTQTSVAAPLFILGEVILSFLNVGFQDSGVSLGAMLRNLTQDQRVLTDFWWNLSPLGVVFAMLLCLNSFSKRLRTKGPAQLA